MKKELVKEFHNNLNIELGRKEKILRQKLKNEFELKLKKQIQAHEADLNKKKINLEIEMQRKIKQVLN